jgi:hypothetical protein
VALGRSRLEEEWSLDGLAKDFLEILKLLSADFKLRALQATLLEKSGLRRGAARAGIGRYEEREVADTFHFYNGGMGPFPLTSERLLLREFCPEDELEIHAYASDPTRHLSVCSARDGMESESPIVNCTDMPATRARKRTGSASHS